jgi:hypothetical protein
MRRAIIKGITDPGAKQREKDAKREKKERKKEEREERHDKFQAKIGGAVVRTSVGDAE